MPHSKVVPAFCKSQGQGLTALAVLLMGDARPLADGVPAWGMRAPATGSAFTASVGRFRLTTANSLRGFSTSSGVFGRLPPSKNRSEEHTSELQSLRHLV